MFKLLYLLIFIISVFKLSAYIGCSIWAKNEKKNSSSMPVTKNCSLLFSSCHLELVISENSQFLSCCFNKKQEKN